MKYDVGQTVFLLSKRDTKVFPAKVVEEITRKSTDGKTVSYVVNIPGRKKTEFFLEELNVEVFHDADSLEKFMVDSASKSIKKLIELAQAKARSDFGVEVTEAPAAIPNTTNGVDEVTEVDLGNGVKGRVDLSAIHM